MAMRSIVRACSPLGTLAGTSGSRLATPAMLACGGAWYSSSQEPPSSTETPSTGDVVPAEGGTEPETSEAPVDRYAGLDPNYQYSKAQLAHYAPDPEKHKRFLPRLSRKDRSSYADPQVEQEFFEEAERFPRVPEGVPLYNLRDVVPEIYQSRSDLHETIKAAKQAMPDKSLDEILAAVGLSHPGPPQGREGARPILEWESTLVLVTGVTESHPANWKARCRVYLRDLQAEAGLSEAALQHIARIAGPRYDRGTGRLRLTSARFPNREDNRREVMRALEALVAEGHRAFPKEQGEAAVGQAAAARA
ncbi:hypothetical protein ACKKBF_B09710 [Auxenochlorella protothecoides x Auxenochlorella symbiontica]|uniref:Small ribosomal subunit protein mS35 mitochondrial conserved domain-containing protein n=2 Tax=Auxenochlorella protothecoides TaxID=3075 RepID=A0A1D2A6K4_AUXPR